MSDFDIDVLSDGTCAVVRVHGDLNGQTSPRVRAVVFDLIENRGQARVIVDLRGAPRIDGPGASNLVAGFVVAEKRHADYILTGLH